MQGQLTSRSRVLAVRIQYFRAMYGLKSKSAAFAEISLTLMGFETCIVDPAIVIIAGLQEGDDNEGGYGVSLL